MTPVSAVDVCTPEEAKSKPGACTAPGGTVAVTGGGLRSGRERYGPAVLAEGVAVPGAAGVAMVG